MSSKKPLQEGDVQSYAQGQTIKKTYPDTEIHLDHIPSKLAIRLAYEEAIPYKLDRDIIKAIEKETTTLATYVQNHRESSTSKINVKLAHIDKDVLALASVRDLDQFKNYELQRGVLSEAQINTAIEKVHHRNVDLGLYTQDEVHIAQRYTSQLEALDLNKHVHIPSYEEVAKEYHATYKEPPKINTDIFENRLAKPSIIVGATLASMVFTEEADASSIPTLHLSTDTTKFDTLSTNEKLGAEIGAGFNAINAIQATEEFKAGVNKSATTLLDTNAYKQGLEQATDAWRPSATKEIVKLGAMDSAKVAGKSFLKKLPLVGLGAGIVFGISRAMDGDWKGAGMEIASGAFSLVPGWGTAASVGMDAALLEKDTALLSHGAEKLLGKNTEETLTQSEDNHTTIESNQNLNLSSDLEKDGFEYSEEGMRILIDNVVSIDDIELQESTQIDTTQKAQEKIAELFPEFQMNHTQENQRVEESREEKTSSYETQEPNSPYVANDNIVYSEEDTLPKNHRPINLQNNLFQQPLEENQLIDEEQFRQAEQRIYDGIEEKYGSSDDYGNDYDRGMEID